MTDTEMDWRRVAAHEAGHAIIGYLDGRVYRRIEWIIDSRGSAAQYVTADTVFNEDERFPALESRLRISVAGAVGAALRLGDDVAYATLGASDVCNDLQQARDTAELLLEDRASEEDVVARVKGALEEVREDLRHAEAWAWQGAVTERLLDMRREKPNGLIVLDSRAFDELLLLVEPRWKEEE